MADFNTSDCRIAWDKFDSPWDKIQWLQHAKVEIKTLADAVLRTEYTKESFFLYTKAMNDEDSAGTSFKVTITLIDIFDIPSPEATLTCTNPAPSQPVGMSATSTSTGILVATTSTLPDDLDVVEVYRHTADVFGSATKIAEIKTQSFNDENVILGDTYYYWYKIRDVYGNLSTVSASANNSSSFATGDLVNPNSGVNIAAPRYSLFAEASLPPLGSISPNSTVSLDSVGYFYGQSLKNAATGIDAYVYLTTNSISYNIALSPNKKWIISAYVKSSIASAAGQLFIRLSGGGVHIGGGFTTHGTIGVWSLVSVIVDCTIYNDTTANLRVDNDAGAGVDMWFDGIMLEEQIGTNTVPSAYAQPVNFQETYVGDLTATEGAPNGTNVGGTEASVVEGDSAKAGLGLNSSGEVKLVIKGPNLPTTGMVDGLNVTQDYLGYYDLAGVSWDAYISSDGTFKFRGDDDNELFWNGSTLVIRGSLNADDISSGHIVGRNITTSGSYLTSAALVSATIISLNSTGIFPASGNAFIGDTQISYTGKTTTTLTGCTNVPASDQDTPVTLDESGITIDTINDRIVLYGNDGTDITSLINFGLDIFDGNTYLGYFGTVNSLRGGMYFLNDASVPLVHIDSSGSGFTPGLAAIHVDIDDGTGTGLSVITGLTSTAAPAVSIVSNGTSADEFGMLIDITDGSDGKGLHVLSSGYGIFSDTDFDSGSGRAIDSLRSALHGFADYANGLSGESTNGYALKLVGNNTAGHMRVEPITTLPASGMVDGDTAFYDNSTVKRWVYYDSGWKWLHDNSVAT